MLVACQYREIMFRWTEVTLMIDANNLSQVLEILGFTKQGQVWTKIFIGLNCSMSVDFKNRRLIYPDDLLGRERNTGFDKKENFVVFECVCRLLDKGYRPKDIELEREWHLGHDPKSGRGDICVSNPDGTLLFIIECKTYGKEYDNALKDTKNDGGQLFSYWQQEGSTKWLMLYTADLNNNGDIAHKAEVINCTDDQNIKQLAQKDKSIKLYINAHTANERYEVWIDTYEGKFYDDIILSEDTVAYQIGVKPLRKKDLHDFTPEDSIVNQFEEILRHNNVSDKENAFNRLVALFICKLVDEINKGEDDEVEFQYKQGTDDYESLQDRLQRLHRDGMEKFMREEMFYISADYPEWLFTTYTGSKRKKAIEDLQNTIRILKFYSNNDFAFKDVHNEELFYQNGKILVEMVQLFEKYRIVYPSKHQFLGDLFEQLLNKGFKQNEGQFFTPMPITRFIWDSLPIDRMVKSERGTVYPKIIDYACGAGHFLTEAIEAINHFVESDDDNSWARDHIYGIEKDYRLARVAKISLFMNGAGEGNIIFGDGLENDPDKGIVNGSFDILVANPPYAVKDFKQHLQLKNNSFTMLERIGLNGSEIEVLFVERIAQLLKPNGIAAVILPSTILTNDSASYIGAREQLLKNFYIRAITALGSNTFGETDTPTVVMFLEKFNEPPKQIDLYTDSIEAVFGGVELSEWEDKEIFEAYMAQIEINENVYSSFLNKELSLEELKDFDYFKMYVVAFEKSIEARNLEKTKAYKKMKPEDKASIYLEKFYSYAHSIEKEKMLYFSLVYHQTTVIITAPVDNAAQKEFLGYKWSKRKGNEGIQILTPGGKLFDASNRQAKGTLADAIKQSFEGNEPSFTEEQQEYGLTIDTKDILDFTRVTFSKSISLYGKRIPKFNSKYPLASLGSLSNEPKYGANEPAISGDPSVDYRYIRITDITDDGYLGSEWMTAENIDEQYILKDGDFLFARTGATAGKYFLYESKYGKAIYAGYLIRFQFNNNLVLPKYVKSILRLEPYTLWAEYNRRGRNISAPRYSGFQIPLPPIPVQKQIVNECAIIEEEYTATRTTIESCKGKIRTLFAEINRSERKKYIFSLADDDKFEVSIGERVLNKELVSDGNVPVYSANVFEPFGYINKLLITDFSLPSVLWGIDGDWMTSFMPENKAFYPTDHCGVLRCLTNEVNPKYLAHILEIEGKKIGFSRTLRASIDRIEGIKISVPSIEEQERVITQVLKLEQIIADAQKKIEALNKKFAEILNSYIN